MTAYKALMAFTRDTHALAQIAGRLGWDQETMMPLGATPQRAEEHGALASVLHARRTDPRIGDWLEAAKADDEVAVANIREVRRSYARASKVPANLATEIAKTTSLAHRVWAEARVNEDVAAFLPMLEKVVALRREEALAIADGSDPYDALLADYEPGASGETIGQMFAALRLRLVPLRNAILEMPVPEKLTVVFDESGQLALSEKLALAFGYDKTYGRIDKAVHPFSSGSGLDVRITTRTNPHDPFNCFYSTIHEVGHAAYEQGIDRQYLLTPLGSGVSMGVHESQSRIYENQIGRSRSFTGWLFGQMRDQFGDFGIANEDAFYACVNRVANGFIRTEADEVQYNLHVLLRFDIERALISGDLQVSDLEAAWNDRFAADFGYSIDKPSNGILQDVHWSEGLFGYFPTYSLGNVYAGCLHESLRKAVPDLDTDLAKGDTSKATGWLREHLQQFGGLRTPRDTISHATGAEPSEEPLLNYLEKKFSDLYEL
ncbi:carboxypeptidase Taq [Cognatiyoonia koreensis]|uniref:Metal-dependent carboxypeptidase n=1 Tax=Cognatiyoonia koreensis TaxID=364200 RepID=A0A1I0PA03_9RHOB|nr:carboxypeptidase M32 [Cognatiyoonia koreensis]SEW11145.1 carboxypeptidase Taq [Cognatiyoonia koreensis]